MPIVRKRYDLPDLNNQGQHIRHSIELDKQIHRIRGLLLVADNDSQMYHRGTFGLRVNGSEVLPEDYHARLLMSGLGVAPSLRYLGVDLSPGNGLVQVDYTDHLNPLHPFAPYQVSLYLELEHA